jgi:hypothetical protein
MAFPFPIKIDNKPTSKRSFEANELQVLRQWFINNKLFGAPPVFNKDKPEDKIPGQLAQIVRVLEQSAGNEPTIYDNGTSRSSATTSANTLTLQVERALTQVLGRSPGRGTDGFVTALNSAFPTGKDGNVLAAPARSVVSLYSPDSEGLSGQLSVEQANLYRQASIIGNDVLDGLQPFNPTADIDAVEALRALIRSQIRSLIDEFGRLDEPRKERVENFFSALGPDETSEGGSLFRFGDATRLVANRLFGERSDANRLFGEGGSIIPVTVGDETQVAGYQLLLNYVNTLQNIWQRFTPITEIEEQVTGRYSERLSRVNIMLPVIADSNISFMSALDSVGFTHSERRSDAALFNTLDFLPKEVNFLEAVGDQTKVDPLVERVIKAVVALPASQVPTLGRTAVITPTLPDMTINDFDEWVDRFTTMEAPSILSESGQYGLDFVTDQADTLFWTIASVLYAIQDPSNQSKLLGKVLSFERVQQTLSELVFQLDTLADLGVVKPLTLPGALITTLTA